MTFEDLMDRSKNTLRSTAPIYRLDERGRLDLFGTGIFFRHDSRHFVLSAAHVLAELREGALRIGGEHRTIPLTGPFFHTGGIGEVSFDSDPFDVAFAALSPEQVSALDGTVFLSLRDIEPAGSPADGARYYATGFIASDYQVAGPNQPVEVEGTALLALPAPPEKYRERGVDEDTHLLLSFDRLKTHSSEGQSPTPKLYGMSGSGVWRVGATDKLAAVAIEHHQRSKFIVATRVDTLIAGLSAYVAGELKVRQGAV